MKHSVLPATANNPRPTTRLGGWMEDAARVLTDAGIDSARLDAALLASHALKLSREGLLLTPDRTLSPDDLSVMNALLSRRLSREPVAYILGKKEFWSLPFSVAPGVLVPRPDTETMIDAALRIFSKDKPLNILDMGTGSGCILLSLLHEFQEAEGCGLDISPQALEIAQKNASDLGLANRASFLLSKWAETLSGRYDLIVSNPPYIETSTIEKLEPEVSLYEPLLALDGGKDGLDAYRQIAQCIRHYLAPGGIVILEVGMNQAETVATILGEHRLQIHSFAKDLSGIDRCVIAKAAF